jgi:beta-glucosidase
MLYAYWPAGTVEWDDVVVKQIATAPARNKTNARRSISERRTPSGTAPLISPRCFAILRTCPASLPPVDISVEISPYTHEASTMMFLRTLSWLVLSATAALPALMASFARAADDDDAGAAAKAEELLKAMTLPEKIGQMTQADLNAVKDRADIARYALGSMLSGGDSDPADTTAAGWARTHDELQSWALKSRLKIPLIYGIDAVHGHNNVDGAVIFPHNIGLGATRDPALVEKASRLTALEMVGTGIRWSFAPCVAVARDERWGRTYESFGEDPALAETLGAAAVRGLQGSSLAGSTSVLACAKHFLGDGGTTGGIDQGNTQCHLATLRKLHLPGYISAMSAGVGTVMASYSSWNGKKLHGNGELLSGLLKNELGFRGFIVSDWAAIDQLSSDYKAAIEASINAGIDMVMIPNGPGKSNNYIDFIRHLEELVNEGKVPLYRIDDAVRRILLVKAKMHLFDHPFSDPSLTSVVGSAEHREFARECVRKSLVLLKNNKGVLPLAKAVKKLVVAGAAADDLGIQCGGWTMSWQGRTGRVTHGGTTILEAVRKTVAPETVISVMSPDDTLPLDADAALVVVGERPYAEMWGDRKDLSLPAEDLAILKKVKDAGVPVVTVVFSGRPVLLGSVLESSDAVIAAWLPGTEGQGITDVLFGDFKPTGKLPHTWPKSMEQIPINVGDAGSEDALFPFGFGLTY